ncbi:uncharacterized protein TNCV_3510061 [Trichonephila clavipes]|nr:uncharacterized protein TNCV_3510061 [Trichonephila clavipes]
MSRFGGLSEERPSVFKTRSKLYRPNVAGMKGRVDLAQTVNRTPDLWCGSYHSILFGQDKYIYQSFSSRETGKAKRLQGGRGRGQQEQISRNWISEGVETVFRLSCVLEREIVEDEWLLGLNTLNGIAPEVHNGATAVLYEGDTRNRWRDGPVCPDVDKELWRLGPDSSAVRSAGCKCLPFLLVKSAREVPAFRFFPEKDKEEVSSVSTCNVKNRICQSEDYNEESVKSLLEGILGEKREARELKERQETREYELERLRLSNATETVSVSSADLEGQGAIKEKVAEDRWVSQLIPLLPIEIAEIVAKEPLEKSDDYPHIKNLLLTRFQLTPIALRDRFESHQRRPGAMWADLVFELRSYLDNWLAGMKVGDFAALKELLVTEQIKKEHQVS